MGRGPIRRRCRASGPADPATAWDAPLVPEVLAGSGVVPVAGQAVVRPVLADPADSAAVAAALALALALARATAVVPVAEPAAVTAAARAAVRVVLAPVAAPVVRVAAAGVDPVAVLAALAARSDVAAASPGVVSRSGRSAKSSITSPRRR